MFILYQTTCLVNGKKYIGIHQQEKDDDYLGSGKWFLRAVRKHGKENFVRETLFTFNSREEAYNKELEVVNEEIVKDPNYYNMRLGGRGGKAWVDKENRQKICDKMKKNWNRDPARLERLRTQNKGRKLSAEHTQKLREGRAKSAQVYSITDGNETTRETLTEFCARVGASRASVNQCVWKRGKYKNWTFTLTSRKPPS